jgi:hypothetical protein
VAGFAEVSDILWRERELLDVLLFKLDQERLLLAEDNVRWLARANHEIDVVLEELRLTELTRAMEVDTLAAELGVEPGPTLAQLAEASPSPWAELFTAHRAAFVTLTAQVRELSEANRVKLDDALRATRESLLALGDQDSP